MELQPISTRGDKPKRGTVYCLVEIDCRNTDQQMISGGFLVPKGVSTVRIQQDELKLLQALVEDQQGEVVRAAEQYERDLQEYIAAGIDPETLPTDRAQRVEELRATFPGSVSAVFRHALKREMRPFASVKVLKENILADDEDERVSAEEIMSARIATAVAAALKEGFQSQSNQQRK